MSRRALRLLVTTVAILALGAGAAAAHPLGNFTVNHMTQVRISSDRIELRYILDQAEIPTFQARKLTDAQRLAAVHAELRQGLRLTIDGRPVSVAVRPGSTLEPRPGQGGLNTTRVEVSLLAAVRGARRVEVRGRHLFRPAGLEGARRPSGAGDGCARQRALPRPHGRASALPPERVGQPPRPARGHVLGRAR